MGAGVQGNGRQVEFQKVQVLHNQGIHSRIPAVPGQLSGRFQLVFIEQGVQGDIHLGAEQMCVITQFLDILDAVTRFLARPEGRSPDIHGIGSMVDGRQSNL